MADFDPTIPLPGTNLERFARFMAKVRITETCWLWIGARNKDGYGWVRVGRLRRAHRVSYEMFTGPLHSGLSVCHTCDVPLCVNPHHLFLGTPAENVQDAVRKQRMARGDANGARLHPERLARGDANPSRLYPERRPRGESSTAAKLTECEVRQIRTLRAAGQKLAAIAAQFGVSHELVSKIARREIWKHVH